MMKRFASIMIRIILILTVASWELEAQSFNYEEWYLQTPDSVTIYVKELCSKHAQDTVIVVHGGFGANHEYMLDAVKGLEDDFYFIFYDQRGSLLSPAPVDKLTFERNVEDLYVLVEELHMNKVSLLCHSMGTLIGMEFAKRYPNKVDKLVLVSAVMPVATQYEDVFSQQVNQNANKLMTRDEVKILLQPYEKRKESLSDKEKTEFWRIQFASVNIYYVNRWRLVKGGKIYYNPEAAVMAKTLSWKYNYIPYLTSNPHVTFIQGNYDFLDFDSEKLKKMLTASKSIKLITLDNAGHNIWLDQPELFRKHIKTALTKLY